MKRFLAILVVIILFATLFGSFKSKNHTEEFSDTEAIKNFIAEGGSPDRALLEAIAFDDEATVNLAIAYGADVNRKFDGSEEYFDSDETMVPLLAAIYDMSNNNVIDALVENGANVNYITDDEVSLLMLSANWLEVPTCITLLENGADVNYTNSKGENALSKAVLNDDNDEYATKVVVELLLDHGADITAKVFENILSEEQCQPYLYNILSILMDRCEENVVDDERLRIGYGFDSLKEFLDMLPSDSEICESDFDTFLFLASANNTDAIKYYIDRKENLDRTNKYGTTMLIAAASSGAIDVVKLLVDNGASIDQLDCEGESAESKARKLNELDCVEELRNKSQPELL